MYSIREPTISCGARTSNIIYVLNFVDIQLVLF